MPRILVLLALVLAAAPASALAAPAVGVADDRVLFGDSPDATVDDWAASGVDKVRIHARWDRIAPAPAAKLPPRGFRPNDPSDSGYDWAATDRAITRVRARGMRVTLAVTGPGPLWASKAPAKRNPRFKPDPRAFAAFARAAAARYGDRVDTWLIWNEPNQPSWLQPQRTCTRAGCVPYAPHLYRELARLSDRAIRTASPGARVVIGTLAPTGSTPATRSANATMNPLGFLRAMACVDTKLHAIRSGVCRSFRAPRADGFSVHPYGITASPATPGPADSVRLADLPRLERTLDRLVASGRLRGPKRMPLHLTEYGYQTNPPDQFLGVSLSRQAKYLSEAAARVARDPRIAELTWYVWRDEPLGVKRTSGWQGGFFFGDGSEKPALRAFRFPLDVRSGRVWGQVRPGGAHTVTVFSGGQQIGTAATGPDGVFALRAPLKRGATLYAVAENGLTSPVVRAR